jgi:hypothetical protein
MYRRRFVLTIKVQKLQQADWKQVDRKQVDRKQVDQKMVDQKQVDRKQVDQKQVDRKQGFVQGCQIIRCTTYQKGEKCI